MEEIRFSTGTLVGFGVSGILMMLLAAAVFLIWRKRTHAPLRPVIVGAIVFPLFALAFKVPLAYPLLFADTDLARTISGNPWLYYLTAGILAGLLEETGRLLAYKWALKGCTNRRTAISYGIGHGGFECLYIGYSMLSLIVMGVMINHGMLGEMTKNVPESQLPAILEKIQDYAAMHFGTSMLTIAERVLALALQIGLSVFVFAAAHEKRCFWLYPLAMLLHAWIDFSLVFQQVGWVSMLVIELLFAVQTAAVCFAAFRILYPMLSGREEGAA